MYCFVHFQQIGCLEGRVAHGTGILRVVSFDVFQQTILHREFSAANVTTERLPVSVQRLVCVHQLLVSLHGALLTETFPTMLA